MVSYFTAAPHLKLGKNLLSLLDKHIMFLLQMGFVLLLQIVDLGFLLSQVEPSTSSPGRGQIIYLNE